ncbi:hypothetical protein [Methyloversatilis discipulorum]|uniref:hypothetical protein n=1 Tax=Methyloversatilis discipulorum TaxID=1119528 RepID=UPI0003695C30|nr:hypothetical protein [Methyloversatilis discipulorum]
MHALDLDPDLLPAFAAELVARIGEAATFALAGRWPGVRLYVPLRAEIDNQENGPHPIVACIGLDAAQKLSDEYGGTVIVVPSCKLAIRARYVNRLVERFYRGESARDLALSEGMTERGMQKLLSGAGAMADKRNLSLFD